MRLPLLCSPSTHSSLRPPERTTRLLLSSYPLPWWLALLLQVLILTERLAGVTGEFEGLRKARSRQAAQNEARRKTNPLAGGLRGAPGGRRGFPGLRGSRGATAAACSRGDGDPPAGEDGDASGGEQRVGAGALEPLSAGTEAAAGPVMKPDGCRDGTILSCSVMGVGAERCCSVGRVSSARGRC